MRLISFIENQLAGLGEAEAISFAVVVNEEFPMSAEEFGGADGGEGGRRGLVAGGRVRRRFGLRRATHGDHACGSEVVQSGGDGGGCSRGWVARGAVGG
jgi:hypothetical protein